MRGLGRKAKFGARWGLPGVAAGVAGSVALGNFLQNRAERSERARGIRSNTEPRDGKWGTVGRLAGGIGGGFAAGAAVAGRLASRHWAVRIGGTALASAMGSVGGDMAGARIGRAFDNYRPATRRRVEKACFGGDEPLEKLFGLGRRRDGDGDGRVGDGTRAEGPAERLRQAVRSRAATVRGAAEGAVRGAVVRFRGFRDLPLEDKAARVVERGLQALAAVGDRALPAGFDYDPASRNAFGALDAIAPAAGLEARRMVRIAKDHRKLRALVRIQLKAARRLIGIAKSDSLDDDTLALAWMAREGLASTGQTLELRRALTKSWVAPASPTTGMTPFGITGPIVPRGRAARIRKAPKRGRRYPEGNR